MTVTYTTPNGRLTFTINVESSPDVFEKLARIDDLFAERECGLCKSADIRFLIRETNNGKFYEMRCNACPARLDFGASRDGTKFWCKRWDKEAKAAMPNRGWYVYDPNKPRVAGLPAAGGDADEGTGLPAVAPPGDAAGYVGGEIPF